MIREEDPYLSIQSRASQASLASVVHHSLEAKRRLGRRYGIDTCRCRKDLSLFAAKNPTTWGQDPRSQENCASSKEPRTRC